MDDNDHMDVHEYELVIKVPVRFPQNPGFDYVKSLASYAAGHAYGGIRNMVGTKGEVDMAEATVEKKSK